MSLHDQGTPAADDRAEMASAQRLAFVASVLAERHLPDAADADDLELHTIRLLELALGVARGLDPACPVEPKSSPGAPKTDWEKLTGKSLDRLIWEARLHAVADGHVRAQGLGGPRVPWKQICETLLKPSAAKWSIDEFRKNVVRLTEHLKPRKLAERYERIDGLTVWNIDYLSPPVLGNPTE